MVIIKDTLDFRITEDTVVTIGKFDGIHNGHVTIINRMKEYRNRGFKTCVLTFDIPPSMLGLGGDKEVIMSIREKEMAFEAIGIDYLVEFPFYEKTASITASRFVEEFIVERLSARAVVVGTDCTFGYGAKGTANYLKDCGPLFGFEVEVLDKLKDGDREISSTYLRELLLDGNVAKIGELSYRFVYINSRLKSATSGITSSMLSYYMDIPEGRMKPKPGVYYTLIFFEDSPYESITYVPAEGSITETHLYQEPKGITSGRSSLVFLDRMCDVVSFENATEKKSGIKNMIFEGEKWHKENFARCAARVSSVEC